MFIEHYDFIKTLEGDFGLHLITKETVDTDFLETIGGQTPDTITYAVTRVVEISTAVTGFIMNHPYGATIRAEFAEPVMACSATTDEDGDELEFEDHSDDLARAILAKLGNIALDPDSELMNYAARG